jgi:tocopherol O-methyltransferase
LTRHLADKARIKRGDRVLDVGCGIGGSSLWLSENLKASTLGITISQAQLEIARRLAKERNANSTFLLMNAEEMQFDETFDVIWAVACSTHFQNQGKFVESASAFLKPGGRFVIFDWMSNENVIDINNDRYLKPVNEGMLLASLCSTNTYLELFIRNSYRITYSEDVTNYTVKTWDDAISVIKDPGIFKYATRINKKEIAQILHFFKSVRAMKAAIKKGKMKAAIIVAEKI